jgi:hypothetical protein
MSEIMCSVVGSRDMVTLDLGINKRGDPVYRISWWDGEKWAYAHYRSFKEARETWKMLNRMLFDN